MLSLSLVEIGFSLYEIAALRETVRVHTVLVVLRSEKSAGLYVRAVATLESYNV